MIILSIISDKMETSEMVLQFWGSVLEPFIKSGLTLAISKLELSLIERFQSLEIDLAKILAPPFKNLPDKLLNPAVLDRFNI